jgi:MFS family permease
MSDDHQGEAELAIEMGPTIVQKLQGLRWSLSFDVANQFFVQLTFWGSIYVLFLNELGLNKTQIGFLLSLFPFFGLVALFLAPWAARVGYKRVFQVFWGARALAAGGLLATPWVYSQFGTPGVLVCVAGIMIAFALLRSTAMTAYMPWQHEFIPPDIRGKYSATSNILISLAGLVAVTISGYVVSLSLSLSRYVILFAAGVLFGFISVWLQSHVPGGKPHPVAGDRRSRRSDLWSPLRDRSFVAYLVGAGLIVLANGALGTFIPLYMREKIGLSTANVILLQNGTLLGGLLSSYLWGWAADRYGAKPVALSGLLLTATLPIWWLIMPRQTGLSLIVALAIAWLQGTANLGWAIGSARLLYVGIVRPDKNSAYMAQYNAWMGVIGGISQLGGGRFLDVFSEVQTTFLGIEIDSYGILFMVAFVLLATSSLVIRRIRAEAKISVGQFAGLFFHGNPILAVESLIRFHLAKDEPAIVSITERLGQSKSPLTVDELLDALADPRFYVRFEAIVSIARRGPDERLLKALARVLEGNDPALSVIAAWALGRIGDPRAVESLRHGLHAPYRSVKAHAARSLATLGDIESITLIKNLLGDETDIGLQIAYASALGRLQEKQAVPELLRLLRLCYDSDSQMELSLSLARIIGEEAHFIQLLRGTRTDPGTSLSQAISGLQNRYGSFRLQQEPDRFLVAACAEALAHNDLKNGAVLLAELIRVVLKDGVDPTIGLILDECAHWVETLDEERVEYMILAVLTLGTVEPV